MSYQSEHRRMKPLLDAAHKWDIATNPDPKALFEAGSAGFQLWCTPDDNPGGVWTEVAGKMIAGAFGKPCAYVGGCHWEWEEDRIIGLVLETHAYLPRDEGLLGTSPPSIVNVIRNRTEDLTWCKKKIRWLWIKAGYTTPLPNILIYLEQGENK